MSNYVVYSPFTRTYSYDKSQPHTVAVSSPRPRPTRMQTKDSSEGAIYKNVFGTYLHGPVLPKNPWFTDLIIQRSLERRYGKIELAPLDDSTENAAHDAALKLAMEFKGTMSAIEAVSWKR